MFDRDFSDKIVNFEDFAFSQFGDAFLFGGAMLLIGMATIFAVLCLLWGCLIVFKKVFHDLPAKKSEALPAKSVEPAFIQEPTIAGNDTELIAVISAAIAMAESENSGMKFRVVSFKRI